ncbi:hypothetical protein [Baekduia sp.]|jgi:hypothetical protein|uniref:hypothetical protein n=1 Tax=Baekduia sp. TaxID=2600305 RepID=UPI002DFC4C44|nr:hypothetical protein [Baekduia sp.]
MTSPLIAAIDDLANAVAKGRLDKGNEAAFRWATALAQEVNRPEDKIIEGGTSGSHLVLYRVVGVDWHHWSSGESIGPTTLHLFRSWVNHRHDIDPRSAGLVGVHPARAQPWYRVDQGVEPQMVSEDWVIDVAAEAPRLMEAWGL